jgi:hypothetical protein
MGWEGGGEDGEGEGTSGILASLEVADVEDFEGALSVHRTNLAQTSPMPSLVEPSCRAKTT